MPNVLDRLPRAEQFEFATVGVLHTAAALYAFAAFSYASYVIFENSLLAIAVGLPFATFLFSLDRLLVLRVRRQAPLLSRLLSELPPLALATLMALSVSPLLELRLLSKDVDQYLRGGDTLSLERLNQRIAGLEVELRALTEQLNVAEIEVKERLASYLSELDGRQGLPGFGPAAMAKLQLFREAQRELTEQRQRLQEPSVSKRRDLAELQSRRAYMTSDDPKARPTLLERFGALMSLSAGDRRVMRIRTVLQIMFFAAFAMPVFSRLLSRRGAYEDAVHRQREFELTQKHPATRTDEIAETARRVFDAALESSELNPRRQKAALL